MFRILAAAALGLMGTGTAQAYESPWNLAKAGMVECFAGNFDQKTCQGLTNYIWQPDGKIVGNARFYNEELVPGAVIILTYPVTIDGDTNCATINPDYADNATFEIAGKPVSDEETTKYRRMLTNGMKEMLGKKICARIGQYGRDYTVQITVDGREMPSMSNWLTFVEKDAGFTLKP